MVQTIFSFFILLSFSSTASANVIFEGYYKILAGDTHVGFAIQKYNFNPKTNQFESISYTRTNNLAGDMTESLKAYSDKKLNPISYNHASTIGSSAKTIEMQFKNHHMRGLIKTATDSRKVDEKINSDVILSAFLPLVMLNSPVGIKTQTNYTYNAIVEEAATIAPGRATVEGAEKYLGQDAFRVKHVFQDIQFISYMNVKGEVLGSNSPAQGLRTELVETPERAIGQINYNANHLRLVFGEIPTGKINSLSQRSMIERKPTLPVTAPSTTIPLATTKDVEPKTTVPKETTAKEITPMPAANTNTSPTPQTPEGESVSSKSNGP